MSRAIARTDIALRAAPSTRVSGARRCAIAFAPGSKRSVGSNASLFVSRGRLTDVREFKVQAAIETATVAETKAQPRTITRLAVPSKGRMAEDTLDLLKVRA
eukprot:6501317-Pyramimonas_sp.AAC.1